MKKVNIYHIFEEEHYSTVLYYAVASSQEEVRELAQKAGISLEGLTIELQRENAKDELGYPYKPHIEDALVH